MYICFTDNCEEETMDSDETEMASPGQYTWMLLNAMHG